MPDIKIPGNPPNTEEGKISQEKLTKIIEKVESLLKEELANTEIKWFLQLRDNKAGMNAYSGDGCPACAILHAIQWALEVQLKHDDDAPFNPLPMPINIVKMNKEDLVKRILESMESKDETKH